MIGILNKSILDFLEFHLKILKPREQCPLRPTIEAQKKRFAKKINTNNMATKAMFK